LTGRGLKQLGVAGVRKKGKRVPVAPDDLWHLGSDTKAMTATLVGLLVQEGALTWDTRVADVFPELAGEFHPDCKAVTVRQLLAHRGGLRKDLTWSALSKTSVGVTGQRLSARGEAVRC
jgi:CubicO group peptidase (beta-lactamase class C family)